MKKTGRFSGGRTGSSSKKGKKSTFSGSGGARSSAGRRPSAGASRGKRDSDDRPKRAYTKRDDSSSDRPKRPYGDRPERSFDSDRPKRDRDSSDFSDRPKRAFGDRPTRSSSSDRSKRPYVKRDSDSSDRPKRPYGDRPERSFDSDRPKRAYTKRDDSSSDRPKRPYGDRPERSFDSDRPKRAYTKRDDSSSDRPKRPYGDRPERSFDSDRPKRAYTKRDDSSSERPARSFDSDRPKRPYVKRDGDSTDRPKRDYGDRPARSFDSDRPKRAYTKRDDSSADRPERSFDSDRPKPSFGDDKRRSSYQGRKEERPGSFEPKKWNRKETHEFYGEKKKKSSSSSSKPRVKDGGTRLNKFISNAGICSRREADDLIKAGVISVNGKVVTEMGFQVMPGDDVKYNKESLKGEQMVYVLLNKPKDFITTTEDPEDRKTVMSLVSKACRERIYPVGRLDRNTTGVLLFTNDGDLARKLTHPSFQMQKVYQVELDRIVKTSDIDAIAAGLTLEDGPIKVDDVVYVGSSKNIVGVELHSGKNRIVRRIFEHLGYEVKKLDRVIFAGLTKKDLPRGRWRFLTDMEVASLKMMTSKK